MIVGTRSLLKYAVPSEDVPGGMRFGHRILYMDWTSIARCGGRRSPDPARRSRDMVFQQAPRGIAVLVGVMALAVAAPVAWATGVPSAEPSVVVRDVGTNQSAGSVGSSISGRLEFQAPGDDVQVEACAFQSDGRLIECQETREITADGEYVIDNLLPDRPYVVRAHANGYSETYYGGVTGPSEGGGLPTVLSPPDGQVLTGVDIKLVESSPTPQATGSPITIVPNVAPVVDTTVGTMAAINWPILIGLAIVLILIAVGAIIALRARRA